MIRMTLAALLGIGSLLAAGGCTSCGHDSCPKAVDAGPFCPVPNCDRKHVYTFLINGLTPSPCLDELRLKIAERGFEKVGYGELCHTWWLWNEMKRIHNCDPEARFVLVGYGFGSKAAVGLARDASAAGWPVDAVVLLDPAGVKEWDGVAERTLVIRSGQPVATDETGRCVRVPGGHFTLPKQPETVDALAVVLAETASRVEHVPFDDVPMFWHPDAPAPRDFTLPEGTPNEWRFLHDRLGPHSMPLVALK
jgi:hypothetical protein